ncbi:hypothetical protein E2C01_043207 [Portunus trituberculatus]|uniref:Uncharacterized protein n=1 Tax=Portunus trituberculatus TaxID=210409 RepID=A0A5B7FWW9_PORTR|nr:hypothetical protein [Portunus trituberculatus]
MSVLEDEEEEKEEEDNDEEEEEEAIGKNIECKFGNEIVAELFLKRQVTKILLHAIKNNNFH